MNYKIIMVMLCTMVLPIHGMKHSRDDDSAQTSEAKRVETVAPSAKPDAKNLELLGRLLKGFWDALRQCDFNKAEEIRTFCITKLGLELALIVDANDGNSIFMKLLIAFQGSSVKELQKIDPFVSNVYLALIYLSRFHRAQLIQGSQMRNKAGRAVCDLIDALGDQEFAQFIRSIFSNTEIEIPLELDLIKIPQYGHDVIVTGRWLINHGIYSKRDRTILSDSDTDDGLVVPDIDIPHISNELTDLSMSDDELTAADFARAAALGIIPGAVITGTTIKYTDEVDGSGAATSAE